MLTLFQWSRHHDFAQYYLFCISFLFVGYCMKLGNFETKGFTLYYKGMKLRNPILILWTILLLPFVFITVYFLAFLMLITANDWKRVLEDNLPF